MKSEYIEQRNGGYYVAGTRISVDTVVHAFNRGETPSEILENYSFLGKLSRVYGTIAFYLEYKSEFDQYMLDSERAFEANSIPLEIASPDLWERVQRARVQMAASKA